MPFNKEDYSLKLEAYQKSIEMIRGGRSDDQKFLLEQRNNWRNSFLVICFGVAAGFFAAGPNITFSSHHRAILFWVSSLLFLFIGLWILIYIKNRLDSDGNETATLMMEQEYYLAKMRNLYREALRDKKEVDSQAAESYKGKLIDKSKNQAQLVLKNAKKIIVADDLWTIALVFAFYFLGFAFVPLHKGKLLWYEVLGLLLVILALIYFKISYENAKKTNMKFQKWRNKLDSVTY
jgi:hypothetical protein